MSAPALAYLDPDREYLLETDTSKLGLGAVLSQKQADGNELVKYDFSLEYQKGKNNTVADALS